MLKLLICLVSFWTIYINASVVKNNFQRDLLEGETVIHNFYLYEVIAKNEDNTYLVKSQDNFNWVQTVDRKDLAVMQGCNEDVCGNDKMFDVNYLRNVSVQGLLYNGEFYVEAIKGWNGFYKVDRKALARTKGCQNIEESKLCVGQTVKDLTGTKMTIIAIHQDGSLVLRSNDGWNSYRSYVDPASVAIIP